MRVLCLSTELPPGPGGIGAHALQVARQLHLLGSEVVVVSAQDYAARQEIEAFNASLPFPVVRLRHLAGAILQGAWWAFRLHRAATAHRTQVVLATGQRAVWLAAAYCATRNLPLMAVGHGTEFGSRRRWQRWLNRRAYSRADLVVSVSEFTRRFMLGNGISPRRETVIPNGADGDFFRPPRPAELQDLRRRFAFADGPLLVTVGTLSERKGQDLVVRSLPAILERVPGVHYAAIGLDHTGGEIARLARQLGLEDRVHCLGRLPAEHVRAVVGAADLFVLPSRVTAGGDVEGFGIAVVEAALCGTPAVVSRSGGLVEAIVDGETGLAVPADDPGQLAAAIITLLGDDERRLAMARHARSRAADEQTWQRRGEHYHRYLRSLLE